VFNFFKRKKPTLLSDIENSSQWIISALNYSGYKVDMNINALKEIDRFFNEQIDDNLHCPRQGGLLYENMGQKVFALSSYIGKVLIYEYGGEWITDDNDEQGEINIAIKFQNGALIFPAQRVIKRIKEGIENNICDYAVIIAK
jgi:hypothetical protein